MPHPSTLIISFIIPLIATLANEEFAFPKSNSNSSAKKEDR